MGFKLRQGISFCEVSERLLFLDIVADRYFCLQPPAEAAFRALVGDRDLDDAGERGLAGMLRAGTLIRTAEDISPFPIRPGRQASLSLLDSQDHPVSALRVASAVVSIVIARHGLRPGRLHHILQALDLAKVPWPRSGTVDLDEIQAAASAFAASARWLRSHDQCLPRSIALARHLAARNLPADLAIGVKLRPFAAHAWVQSGSWLVNDRIDTIRSYTPILVI